MSVDVGARGIAARRLVQVCRLADVPVGGMKCVKLPGRDPIAVYNVDGQVYATDDMCTHGQASLSEDGLLEGCIVECSWHFGAFDVRSGEAVAAPCSVALRTYKVIVDGAFIYLGAEEGSADALGTDKRSAIADETISQVRDGVGAGTSKQGASKQ